MSRKGHAVRFDERHPLWDVREDVFLLIKDLLDPVGFDVMSNFWHAGHPSYGAGLKIERSLLDQYGIGIVSRDKNGQT